MRIIIVFFSLVLVNVSIAKKFKENEKPEWAKKDIRDYTEADMERLLEQWEEDDEPLEEDELPEHLRPLPKLDMSQLDPNNPQSLLEASKKGRTLMTFVSVSGNPTREETEELTKLWQTSLWNNHIQAERYLVDDDRAIFLFKDGSQAWTAKEYLVKQERCKGVTIEGKEYPGEFANVKEEL
ncbi:LDLR chaperone boca [Tribolium castaneum]|uniref:LDLR chaperone boca-like Protein n=1 Tax=Tribolium castaneum TaxID=7070 RepID=D6WAF9_TRICA|nr:PREDICTED: LDLR chaperone boca [Tribolium castaneum]EEZ98006.1 LDLR chaperone boca-like Protein [Tribolium castaneum]|eukprot:XP_973520.1 PREDICTED: LDLR chaperone boca [Tribolium castaneum]